MPLILELKRLRPTLASSLLLFCSVSSGAVTPASAQTDTARLAWEQHYASGSTYDNPTAMAVDASGNAYVTGTSPGPTTGTDYATIKYDPSGVEQWVAHYDGADDADLPAAIAVDGMGNVYVTGWSRDSSGVYDYCTIKYGASGEQLWVARYSGPVDGEDEAKSIALDPLGNVYVTGYSDGGLATGYDFATIKYNSDGDEQWVMRYDGPGNDADVAVAMAVDSAGNVYVTGYSTDASNYIGYATVKYNTDGIEQWVEQYHGPGNPPSDYPKGIAVDNTGNVYVTGHSYGGLTTGVDYGTVKYNSDGAEQWVARFSGSGGNTDDPVAIAVDDPGNVYVTGTSYGGSSTSEDYTTVKYDAAGNEQWVMRYDGPASSYDYALDLAVDPMGSVFVTGNSYGNSGIDDFATVQYDASGVQQWVAQHGGPGNDRGNVVTFDQAGNVYVAGSESRPVTYADGDYATIKYNSGGVEQWVSYYRGWDNSLAFGRRIQSDGAGGAYVTGWSTTYTGMADYTTIRYNNLGMEQWIQRYNGPADSVDLAAGMAVDEAGNVVVTGSSVGGTSDYATIMYSPAGTQEWVQRYDGPGNAADEATAIAVDLLGNVYVTGWSIGSGSSEDFATIKYNPDGLQQWIARYNGPGNSTDQGVAIALDDAGNVYVTGSSQGSSSMDYATVKYNSAGVQQWVGRYNGPDDLADEASAIAIDASGNVYVTGRSEGSGTNYDCATVMYNLLGVEQWDARYTSAGSFFDETKSIAVDGSGGVYVAGTSYSTTYDFLTIKYGPAGTEEWVRVYDGPAGADDHASTLTLDEDGDLYVTGGNTGLGTGLDALVIKYDPSGNELWQTRYNAWDSPNDAGSSIDVDPDGFVWVAGTSSFPLNQHIYTALKYVQDPLSSVSENVELPSQTSLSQNYPNPFNPTTIIRYALAEAGRVTVRVYDVLGQEVKTLTDDIQGPGEHRALWDGTNKAQQRVASGVYFYRLSVSKNGSPFYSSVKRMILLH